MKPNRVQIDKALRDAFGGGKKRNSPESDAQKALFEMIRRMEGRYPILKLVFAIPNGSAFARKTNPKTGVSYSLEGQKARAEGLRAGVPDIFCAVVKLDDLGILSPGLFIEMKSGTSLSAEQKEMIAAVQGQYYRVEVCRSWEAAWAVIVDHCGLPKDLLGK